MLQCNHTKNLLFLVELALAERDSKNATFFFRVCAPNGYGESWSQAFLPETVETGDKYLDVTKAMHGKA